MRIPVFRIWYSTTYTTLFIILAVLLTITPGDTIYQSIKAHHLQSLFVIGGAYLLTFFIVLLVYSTRLYTNRTVLSAIPKGYLPVEDGEVGKGVRKIILKHLRRSALVAWDCRPRDTRGEIGVLEDSESGQQIERSDSAEREKDKNMDKSKIHKRQSCPIEDAAVVIPVSAKSPPWGHISHPGWASPSSLDLPNLQYSGVICELPNLIEAKAVSLAPPDPILDDNTLHILDGGPPLPDAEIVALLLRPRTMCLRQYLSRLLEFGILNRPRLTSTFLDLYESARFSTTNLTEIDFRELMAVFADLLNGMTEIDPGVVEEARAQNIMYEGDTRSLATTESSLGGSPNSSTASPNINMYRTPQLNHLSSSTSSTNLEADSLNSSSDIESPQTIRTARAHQYDRGAMIDMSPRAPSQRSFRSLSDTGSVLIRSFHHRNPSTILPDSSSEGEMS